MTNSLNELFEGEAEGYQHPKLRYWLGERVGHPERHYRVEVYRPKVGFTFGPARLYLHVSGADGAEVQPPDEMFWDDDLDEGFISAGFPAISAGNEQLRFSLALRRSFSRAERRYGQGLFNAVMVSYVRESALAEALSTVLSGIEEGSLPVETLASADCREILAAGLKLRARQLADTLGYDRHAATAILTGALGRYLDERFHVSSRSALGLAG